ncbi:MAG: hypothetical protein SGPRY_012376, partial [Prymnesium sp.]
MSEGVASRLVAEMRRELGACLRLVQEGGAAGESVDARLSAFSQAAGKLQKEFTQSAHESGVREHGSSEASLLAAEIEILRAELQHKDTLLETHKSRLRRWQEECTALQLDESML